VSEREVKQWKYREVPLSAIQRPAVELRTAATESGMSELRSSIAERGILVPVIVASTDIGYRLVAGKRRVLCAESLGLATVPAVVVPPDERWEMWATAAENRVRESVNAVDEAQWLQRRMEQLCLSGVELAAVLGVSPSYVSQRLSSLQWPEDVRAALASGELSFS